MEYKAQLHSVRKTTIGDVLITLSIDKAYAGSAAELMFHDIGTQFGVTMIEDGEVNDEGNNDALRKFQIKMHAKIRDVAEQTLKTEEEIKSKLKAQLKVEHLIKESTTELTIKGYLRAIHLLDTWNN